MNIEFLLESAGKLNPVSENSSEEYSNNFDELLSLINSKMINRSDIGSLIGKENIEMMKDNHANHVRFMSSIFQNYNPQVLVNTILWVFRAYKSHGFNSSYWSAQINSWIAILEEKLSEKAYSEIYPYYQWIQVNIPIFEIVSVSIPNDGEHDI